jgi:Kinesin motor domain
VKIFSSPLYFILTKSAHIPFRASKLTLVLRDSFMSRSVNTKIMMIACVCPISSSTDHSINTLRYANRLKEKPNKVYDNASPPPMPQVPAPQSESPSSNKNNQRSQTSSSAARKAPGSDPAIHKEEQKQEERLPVINSLASAPNIKKPGIINGNGNGNKVPPQSQQGGARQPLNSNKAQVAAPNTAWSKKAHAGVSGESSNKKPGTRQTPSTKYTPSMESSETDEEDGRHLYFQSIICLENVCKKQPMRSSKGRTWSI